jgi:hypothetical protein
MSTSDDYFLHRPRLRHVDDEIRYEAVQGEALGEPVREGREAGLGVFAYRFNHRFDLRDLIFNLTVDVTRSKPMPKKVISGRHAEAGF